METNTNTNAYGIRLAVLNIAHDDCFQLFEQKLNAIRENKPYKNNGGVTDREALTEQEITSLYPTTGQIQDRAKALYKFICEK